MERVAGALREQECRARGPHIEDALADILEVAVLGDALQNLVHALEREAPVQCDDMYGSGTMGVTVWRTRSLVAAPSSEGPRGDAVRNDALASPCPRTPAPVAQAHQLVWMHML